MQRLRYRLALDLGSTSLGWGVLGLNGRDEPCSVIRAGVRIFSDGRNPKDGSSLAVSRRDARAMRRRRDRLLKRKHRMVALLQQHGFFPADIAARKALERLNPYELRAKGLNESLTPPEFARALFHINQRRGFKSNRKTDKKDNDSGALKTAINALRQQLDPSGADGKPRTVGELLWRRMQSGEGVRARYRERRVDKGDGKPRIDKSYDLYIDRAMIEAEFDALWSKQAALDPVTFNEGARTALKDTLLHQRPLRPVKPGRCTLEPNEPRAPLALPSQQRFRILQEVNHLRTLGGRLLEEPLNLEQRNALVEALERNGKRSFTQIRTLLKVSGNIQFNIEDPKRQDLKGNATSATLSKKDLFGSAWFDWSLERQDKIVTRLLTDESEATLIRWLREECGVDEVRAECIANAGLAEGYGSLSTKALAKILPELQADVVTYDKAVQAAGYGHHSHISHAQQTGEILPELPYYGEYLQRHVGFGSGDLADPPEKRFGKIANPTVHIGLNQVRVVVNALIKRYGHPKEVIVEVARELKQSREQRLDEQKRQAENQKRNERLRAYAAEVLELAPERVKHADIQKLILWEELSRNPADRRCPYSGVQIGGRMALSAEVEIEHILPFSQTLDDSLNNKTLATRRANRVKGNRTPAQAHADFEREGWTYADILARAELMPRAKRYRFAEDGMEKWQREDKDFLARALNDTRHLSRVAREYLSLICPQGTRVIPGQMTAMLRAKFGLNDILGLQGEKNRNDHRHHAVDACVIGVTDQGLLQRFAQASASAREAELGRLVDDMPLPWETYREHVARAVGNILVSHKPDHGHEGAMHNDTAYALLENGEVSVHKTVEGKRVRCVEKLKVIEFAAPWANPRHGTLSDGRARPYKGYKGDSNYCIEIVRSDKGQWGWAVISTFEAYQRVSAAMREARERGERDMARLRLLGLRALRDPRKGMCGRELVMRLMIGDYVCADFKGSSRLLTIKKIKSNGGIFVAEHQEANVRQREDAKDASLVYGSFSANSLRKSRGRQVAVTPIGELRDPGFRE